MGHTLRKMADEDYSVEGKGDAGAAHNIDSPFVTRSDYQVMDIGEDGYLSLMDPEGNTREDLSFPEGTDDDAKVVAMIKDYFEAGDCDVYVTVLGACGTEKVVDCKKQMA